jgi:hypothetical protein
MRSSDSCSSESWSAARMCGSNCRNSGKVLSNSSRTRCSPSVGLGSKRRTGASASPYHRGDERAAAGEVPIGGGPRYPRLRRHLGHRRNPPALHEGHGLGEQTAIGPSAGAALGARRLHPAEGGRGDNRLDKGRHRP